MFRLLSLLPSLHRGPLPVTKPTVYHRRAPPSFRRKTTHLTVAFASRNGIPAIISELQNPNPIPTQNLSSSILSTNHHLGTSRNSFGFQPSTELGLLSILFVLSTAIASVFSLAIISIPALAAFRRLAASMDKLSKVVSEEVPGTLSSLKLSGLEINELTQQLGNIRQKVSGNQYGRNDRRDQPSVKGERENPIVN